MWKRMARTTFGTMDGPLLRFTCPQDSENGFHWPNLTAQKNKQQEVWVLHTSYGALAFSEKKQDGHEAA